MNRHLLVVACGAGPASDIGQLVQIAHEHSWTVNVIATTSGLAFLDRPRIEDMVGSAVRSDFQDSLQSSRRTRRIPPTVDAVIVAPATFNTISKLALGIADNYALTSVAELIGRGVHTVCVPFVNSALASRAPYLRSVALLRDEGIQVFGPDDGWTPHQPGAGEDKQREFPWRQAFVAATTRFQ